MAAYELLLRSAGRDEIRLTDREVVVGETIRVDDALWLVVSKDGIPTQPWALARYVCEPVGTDGANGSG